MAQPETQTQLINKKVVFSGKGIRGTLEIRDSFFNKLEMELGITNYLQDNYYGREELKIVVKDNGIVVDHEFVNRKASFNADFYNIESKAHYEDEFGDYEGPKGWEEEYIEKKADKWLKNNMNVDEVKHMIKELLELYAEGYEYEETQIDELDLTREIVVKALKYAIDAVNDISYVKVEDLGEQ